MTKIIVSIQHGLLAEAVTKALQESDDFQPIRIPVPRKGGNTVEQCQILGAEMLLAEVSYAPGTTLKTRLEEMEQMRQQLPGCKLVLLCDENSTPEIAHAVMLAKKDGRIDAFFYASVTTKYLLAALASL